MWHPLVDVNAANSIGNMNKCKSESVKLLPEATLKVTNCQNSCSGWASACIKDQLK